MTLLVYPSYMFIHSHSIKWILSYPQIWHNINIVILYTGNVLSVPPPVGPWTRGNMTSAIQNWYFKVVPYSGSPLQMLILIQVDELVNKSICVIIEPDLWF